MIQNPEHFILASSSPRRKELLSTLGIPFEIIKPDVDETQLPDEAPHIYVQRLSQRKARTVAEMIEGDALILAADTIVVFENDLLGKPADPEEAREMLNRLHNRPHEVSTAFTLMNTASGATITELTTTTVYMRDYTADEITAYIASGDPFDKAGGYAIQNEAFHPVERIEGSYNNVVGLPIEVVKKVLQSWGVL